MLRQIIFLQNKEHETHTTAEQAGMFAIASLLVGVPVSSELLSSIFFLGVVLFHLMFVGLSHGW